MSIRPLAVLTAALILAPAASCDDGNDSAGTVAEAPGAVEVETTEPGAPPPLAMAIDTLVFTTEDPAGVTLGFNLDGVTSPEGEDASCGHGDFTSPEGAEGIDNQVAIITPLLDLVGFGAVGDLVQRSIEEGGLLIMFELDDVEDLDNDPEVSLTFQIGNGTPLLGTDGLLLSGQTFEQSAEHPATTMPNAKISAGVLTAGPFDARLPIVVFGVLYELDVEGAYFSGELTYDGGIANGVLGGAVPMANLWEIISIASMEGGGIIEAATLLLDGIADMDPDTDGVCQSMSGAFQFTAVSAFFAE